MKTRTRARGRRWPSLLGLAAGPPPSRRRRSRRRAVDEKAAMEAWQKAMTPGEGQKKLEPMVGTFETKVRTWMDPDPKPPEDTAGSPSTRGSSATATSR